MASQSIASPAVLLGAIAIALLLMASSSALAQPVPDHVAFRCPCNCKATHAAGDGKRLRLALDAINNIDASVEGDVVFSQDGYVPRSGFLNLTTNLF